MITKTINFTVNTKTVSLIVPWEDTDRRMLFMQNGFWPVEHFNDDQVINVLSTRLSDRLQSLLIALLSLNDNAIIIDIGAGNSLVDFAIQALLPEKNFKFVLIDGNDDLATSTKTRGFYNEQEYDTYNSWSFVNSLINVNNFNKDNFSLKSPTDDWGPQCDLIMTLSSCGWHYPIDVYLNKIVSLVKDGGYFMCAGLLNIDNAFNKVNSHFKNVVLHQKIEFNAKFSPSDAAKMQEFFATGRVPIDNFASATMWKK